MPLLSGYSAWLKALGVAEPIRLDSMPDKPDEVVVLTATGGFGLQVEGAIDNPTVQVRTRAPKDQGARAEALSHRIDGLILDAEYPTRIGGKHVTEADRVGGAPAFLRKDDAGRTEYVCNYRMQTER